MRDLDEFTITDETLSQMAGTVWLSSIDSMNSFRSLAVRGSSSTMRMFIYSSFRMTEKWVSVLSIVTPSWTWRSS